MTQRRAVTFLTLLALALYTWAALAQQPRSRAARPAKVAGPAIATVANRRIGVAEFEQRVKQLLVDFAQRNGSEIPASERDVARRQVLEGLIRERLYTLEAKRLGIVATAAEGEDELKRLSVFGPEGRFDEARFRATKVANPAAFAVALQEACEYVAARRLNATVDRRLSPSQTWTEARATRELTRVSLDILSLRASEFTGTDPEPREAQVLAWYRDHTRDFDRKPHATLTVVLVNTPVLAESLRENSSAIAEWDLGMRHQAERIIARVRAGESLDSVAAALAPRGKILVEPGGFPGYWRGTEAQAARIFSGAEVGRVQPEPIRGTDGWLVVRVDDSSPSHLASFGEASREIRALLRKDARLHHDEIARRAMFAELRDSLVAPGRPIRYAAVDTASVRIPEPSEQDLDTYFRAHQADYASFDARTGGIVTRTMAEVHDDVRSGFFRERKLVEARTLAGRLLRAWQSGHHDTDLEARLGARVTAAVVSGSRIDTGLVAKALSDTIWKMPDLERGGLLPYRRGIIAWQGLALVERVSSSFEQVSGLLAARVEQRQAEAELAGAKALYDADPDHFRRANRIHFTRLSFLPPVPLRVPLTRPEVEKWYREHLDKYSQPEMVNVRHILVSPVNKSAAADAQALAKAREILRRIQAGESFATLAQAYSEDPATRDIGGEMGSLPRGSMLDAFEQVVFSLPSATLYDRPVKTELGYHVVEVIEHLEPVIKPLNFVYGTVAMDAAGDKANRMAAQAADSFLHAVKNPRVFATEGARAGAKVLDLAVGADEKMNNPDSDDFFTELRRTPPGHILSKSYPVKGQGVWLGVVDSITAGGSSSWDQARNEAIVQYRQGAGQRALDLKRAELDSLLAGGMSFDSLGAYWGGLVRVSDQTPGRALPIKETSEELDSLIFGGRVSGPGLPPGRVSAWTSTAGGISRVRIESRTLPTGTQVAERSEKIRVGELQQKLIGYFSELKARYPVVILDPQLRDIQPFPDTPPAPAR